MAAVVPAELLAFGAALLYASAFTLVKLASVRGDVMLGYLGSVATGAAAISLVAIVTVDSWEIPLAAVLLHGLAGLFGPGVGRLLNMRAVRDVGSSVAVPVQSSSNPLISSLAGVVLFDEVVGPHRLLALALIIAGIWWCVRGGSANRPLVPGGQGGRTRALMLPLAAGAAYAAFAVINKAALAQHDLPVLGALIAMVTALFGWLALVAGIPPLRPPVRLTASFGWFLLSGLMMAGAQVSLLFALQAGDLSLVTPIIASQPVIVVILAAVLLRDVERLRVGTVAGSGTVLAGLVYLSMT